MSKTTLRNDRQVAHLVERRLRCWEIERGLHRVDTRLTANDVQPFIAISRMVGAGGMNLARALSRRLSWPYYDREILLIMASGDESAARLYDSIDEHDRNWLEFSFSALMVSRNDYLQQLKRVVLELARRQSGIFLGRGADLILPRRAGLRVRLVADRKSCEHRYAERKKISLDQARLRVARIESDRASWIRHQLHHDPEDPGRYDLTLNTDYITLEESVELILSLMRARGLAGVERPAY